MTLSLFEKLQTVNKQLQAEKKEWKMLIEQHNFFSLIRSYNLAKCVNETEKNCSYSELDLRKKAAASKQAVNATVKLCVHTYIYSQS